MTSSADGSMPRLHLVARTYPGLEPLWDFDACAWLWRRLQQAFPTAHECVLMPNGVHLGVDAPDRDAARLALAHVLRGFSRRHAGGQRLFEPVPVPVVVPDAQHQWRTSRYVALNPNRKHYVRDPLEWLWSTYRDVMGAVAEPWITTRRFVEVHGRARAGFEATFHRYVSGDPTVQVAGTPVPVPAPATDVAGFALQRIRVAAAAAHRVRASQVLEHRDARRLFVALARDQGWPNAFVASACGMTARHIRRIDVPPSALSAGRLCLNDDRLLIAVDDLSRHGCPQRGHLRAVSLEARPQVPSADIRLH